MATAKSTPDPFDDVRDAFADLGTSEKAAFVLEATFETLGQALSETGRRAASVLDDLDIDSWFRTWEPQDVGAPPPPPPAPPPASKPAPKATRKKPPTTPKKTAGKPKPPTRRPPADDEG
ncbi:hypothetical protein [Rubrivirga sp.]|uniref:hypothetical protein n=1 Tax=Rubrivirga sp. TaxID=1885344 RepID=UPI003B525CE3